MQMMNNNVVVTVCMITYNQEQFITEAIEGVLMQKGDFSTELLISDDCSTDNTRKICLEFQKKFPKNIRLLLPNTNMGMNKNFIQTLKSANGKYIAICEGDDYWVDPYKLQKQVDFLESNVEYGFTHSDCNILFQKSGKVDVSANKRLVNNSFINNSSDLFAKIVSGEYKIRTATVLFRTELIDNLENNPSVFLMGDTPMWLQFSQITKFKYFDEIFAVYRVLSNSASHSSIKKKQYRFTLSMYEMRIFYLKKYNYQIEEFVAEKYNKALLDYKLFDKDYKEIYALINPSKYQLFKNNHLKSNYLFDLFYIVLKLGVIRRNILYYSSKLFKLITKN